MSVKVNLLYIAWMLWEWVGGREWYTDSYISICFCTLLHFLLLYSQTVAALVTDMLYITK